MGAILELVASITRVFNITDEEVLAALLNDSDEFVHICELINIKWRIKNSRKLKLPYCHNHLHECIYFHRFILVSTYLY